MTNGHSHFNLRDAARRSLIEHGFQPDFPAAALDETEQLKSHPPQPPASARDLRHLLWSSIDNDTSRDLDQIEYAERLPNGDLRVMVAVADVDLFVTKGSALDRYALAETATIYTGVENFSMLPEALSTGLTSLLEHETRAAMVADFTIDAHTCIASSEIYPAIVVNKAQLAYPSVGAWLAGTGPAPKKVAASAELQAQLRLQHEIAQRLRLERYRHGALNIETIETQPVMMHDEVVDVAAELKNPATELIEDFMIAANGVVARTLAAKGFSSIRRVVKTPRRWDRIVELAKQQGGSLPATPDSKALHDFLCERKKADPDHFTDLSLAVVKLLGPGEYVLERPGDPPEGHFGLAVQDYTHSTAPNRRYADLVTQRLLKAMLQGRPSPYSDDELASVAAQCTRMEDADRKVEREMQKRIAAVAMSRRVGETFSAIVTGVNQHGTFARALAPHVEGMVVHGQQGVDVGDRIRVKLVRTDPWHGFIDFARI
ncbi:RNB domain-containing ribonuclease [Paracidobacterium acidisoli]|uniref:RNB domain-containing ribonuclease n=1 Tax=Paracidobacterium acidisoli TaxID=2303751 RepID=A0A372IJW6_9BACT|nr:RNB domain-containing ribonuclease [Paracidobacterium acidisoli]MBT9333206.1 RNB domain-containing ribonuclease [Paracidobacterium acidisoli]